MELFITGHLTFNSQSNFPNSFSNLFSRYICRKKSDRDSSLPRINLSRSRRSADSWIPFLDDRILQIHFQTYSRISRYICKKKSDRGRDSSRSITRINLSQSTDSRIPILESNSFKFIFKPISFHIFRYICRKKSDRGGDSSRSTSNGMEWKHSRFRMFESGDTQLPPIRFHKWSVLYEGGTIACLLSMGCHLVLLIGNLQEY